MKQLALLTLLLFLVDHNAAIRWSNTHAPKVNLTIEATNGTSQHESVRILCYPLTWPSLAAFYAGNFVAHIATVQSTPGEKWPLTLFNMVLALFFPTSGLMRGLNAIVRNFSSSRFARKIVARILCVKRWRENETNLEKACKAGALCIVVRNSKWRPKEGQANIPAILSFLSAETDLEPSPPESASPDVEAARSFGSSIEEGAHAQRADSTGEDPVDAVSINLKPIETILTIYQPVWLQETQTQWWNFFDTLWGRNTIDTALKTVHGSYILPEGYSFAILPRNAVVRSVQDSSQHQDLNCEISSSHSMTKILASIAQLLVATYTLWLHRGNQITRWGFASFAFVPIPYAIMSLANGISKVFTPEYPAVYMVSSSVMKEAEDAGGIFCGIVGHVLCPDEPDNDSGYDGGFDSNWQGLTAGFLRRTMVSSYNLTTGREWQVMPILVSEQKFPGCIGSELQLSNSSGNNETAELTQTSNSFGLPTLLVRQDRTLNGESYIIKATHHPELTIEGTAYNLPKWYVTWMFRYGSLGISFWIIHSCYKLLRHPHETFCSTKLWFLQMSYFWKRQRTHRQTLDDKASILPVRKSLKDRLYFFINPPTSEENDWNDQLHQDRLPRISFRACERFQRQDDVRIMVKNKAAGLQLYGLFIQATIGIIVSGSSLLIIGSMSGFRAGSSSRTEQIILMMWLATGIVVGFMVPFFSIHDAVTLLIRVPQEICAFASTGVVMNLEPLRMLVYVGLLIMCIPWGFFVLPVWGFIILGQQLDQWGTCVTLY